MTSRFGWIDFAEEDRQRMLDVVKLFRMQDTRDELGVGAIRDAFAEHFFPGTMTMQTRARYFLLVPWVYQGMAGWLQRGPRTRDEVDREVRQREARLITALIKAGEDRGVIGSSSRANLQRMPSSIYWTGLGVLGIRQYPGSQTQYHRRLSTRSGRPRPDGPAGRGYLAGEGGYPVRGAPAADWHMGLPDVPRGFPDQAAMALRPAEARYLRDRIIESRPTSLFAELLRHWREPVDVHFAWEHPVLPSLSSELRETIAHARNFSQCLHGVALLYNLMLAEKCGELAWGDDHRRSLAEWAAGAQPRWAELRSWGKALDGFWRCLAIRAVRIPPMTRVFVERVLSLLLGADEPEALQTDRRARELIRARELQLKGRKRARLESPEALARWNGESGTAPLTYRWPTAGQILDDICAGLARTAGGGDA